MPGIVLGAGDIAVIKITKGPAFQELYILEGEEALLEGKKRKRKTCTSSLSPNLSQCCLVPSVFQSGLLFCTAAFQTIPTLLKTVLYRPLYSLDPCCLQELPCGCFTNHADTLWPVPRSASSFLLARPLLLCPHPWGWHRHMLTV